MKKYAEPSREMLDALANEGLTIHWPRSVKSDGDLIIYGNYSTGVLWDKTVFLDLRDEMYDLSTENGTDMAIALQLKEANEDYSVNDELAVFKSVKDRMQMNSIPATEKLRKDFEVAKKKLERFDKVADAIANGNPIPPVDDADEQEYNPVTISYATASEIVYLLKCAREYLESKYHQGDSCVAVVNLLRKEMGKPEDYN